MWFVEHMFFNVIVYTESLLFHKILVYSLVMISQFLKAQKHYILHDALERLLI